MKYVLDLYKGVKIKVIMYNSIGTSKNDVEKNTIDKGKKSKRNANNKTITQRGCTTCMVEYHPEIIEQSNKLVKLLKLRTLAISLSSS